MSDWLAQVFTAVLLALIGILFIWLGWLIWKKEKITLIHDYHTDKVSPENKKAFCTESGIGMICIGGGIFLTGLLLGITGSVWGFLAFAAGFLIGIVLMMRAIVRYNR
jgi:hypothetical protein